MIVFFFSEGSTIMFVRIIVIYQRKSLLKAYYNVLPYIDLFICKEIINFMNRSYSIYSLVDT